MSPMKTLDSVVGKIHQLCEETVVEWSIPHFSTLSDRVDDKYKSPLFTFLDTFWWLRIYLNGNSANNSEGYIGLYLVCEEFAPKLTVSFTFAFKPMGGPQEEMAKSSLIKFDKDCRAYGRPKLMQRSEILERRSELLPDDLLIVCCTLKSSDRRLTKASLHERLLNASRNMLGILKGKQRTDVLLKVDGQEIEAHKVILEARSEVFRKMLSHDMLESKTEVIKIDDIEADVFRQVLDYMYSGQAKVTAQNVLQLCLAADKYDLQELKTLCTTFMEDNITDDLFCDVFTIADTCGDTELMQVAEEYLGEHSGRIIETEKWKKFASENQPMAIQILTMMVKINVTKVQII